MSTTTGSEPAMSSSSEPEQFQTAAQYSDAVRQWLWKYHHWNSMNYHMSMMSPFYQMGAYSLIQSRPPASLQQTQDPVITSGYQGQVGVRGRFPQPQQARVEQQQAVYNRPGRGRTEYVIPPIWKRVTAELIDFFFLLIIKIGVACLLVDFTGGGLGRELAPITLDQLMLDGELDLERLLSMTTELMIIEVINRVFISVFEAMCLRHGINSVGGSTPGKRIMALCVVSCTQVTVLPNNKIAVIPAQNIGFWKALTRSVIKNFSMAFLFPICFSALFFQHGRAAYDILANCIVVESRRD